MKKIAMLGFGRMGSWLALELRRAGCELLVFDPHLLAKDFHKSIERAGCLADFSAFAPQLLINAAPLNHTVRAFEDALPFLSELCVLADICSIKEGLRDFYNSAERPFVSVHPMFGPTFAPMTELQGQNGIIISESCSAGKEFFRRLFEKLEIRIFELGFDEHDKMMGQSLSVPFLCSLLFAEMFEKENLPGTTYARHLEIARGLLSEDADLIAGVLRSSASVARLGELLEKCRSLIGAAAASEPGQLRAQLAKLRAKISRAGLD